MFKYAMTLLVKNEHDYINQFLEHHINIGFEFFYLIIDNLAYTQIDYMDTIADEFKNKIKLFYLDTDFVSELWKDNALNNCVDYCVFIQYFNTIVFPLIDSEWICVNAVDSFIYFNNRTIDEFFNNIREDVDQIAIPWLVLLNVDDTENEDFLHNMDKYYNITHNHTFACAKTSNVLGFTYTDHFLLSKKKPQIIYSPINDTYIETADKNLSSIVFPKSTFNVQSLSSSSIFSIHVMLRNYDEFIIKDYFSWKVINETNRNALEKLIKNVDFASYRETSKSRRCDLIFLNSTKINNCELKIQNYKYKNTKKYCELLIQNVLDNINSDTNEYNLFIKKVKEIRQK
jgi:hypothetical protein